MFLMGNIKEKKKNSRDRNAKITDADVCVILNALLETIVFIIYLECIH